MASHPEDACGHRGVFAVPMSSSNWIEGTVKNENDFINRISNLPPGQKIRPQGLARTRRPSSLMRSSGTGTRQRNASSALILPASVKNPSPARRGEKDRKTEATILAPLLAGEGRGEGFSPVFSISHPSGFVLQEHSSAPIKPRRHEEHG